MNNFVSIAYNLNFDVAGLADQLLDIKCITSEGCLGFGLAPCIGLINVAFRQYRAHTAPAAPRQSLNHYCSGSAKFVKKGVNVLKTGGLVCAGEEGDALFLRKLAGCRFVAEQRKSLWRRANESYVRICARPGKVNILA